MRLQPTTVGKSLLTSLHLWTQSKGEYPEVPHWWRGLLSTNIFLELCADVGPVLEVKEASFAALYEAVQAYSKYAEDWSAAELYLACRGLAHSRCLVDIYPPVPAGPVVREILGKFYAAIANPERLRIVLLLQGADKLLSVTEIAACLDQTNKLQSIRRHLHILHDVRIVERHWADGAGRYQSNQRAITANLELTGEALEALL